MSSSAAADIPAETCAPFGAYPNPLQLTEADRATFHPVVRFPVPPTVLDFTEPHRPFPGMATEEQRQAVAEGKRLADVLPSDQWERVRDLGYTLGRYDEPRVNLYESAHFDDTDQSIESFAGRRNLHVGVDLGGPVGTSVYAFTTGRVHAVGVNPALGDYGHVVVVQHELPRQNDDDGNGERTCYALYGHLDASVVKSFRVGDVVTTGQRLGAMGGIDENGGWMAPHVHFQLSLHAPVTHDLPGAVAAADRARALVDFPDPRCVLGELY